MIRESLIVGLVTRTANHSYNFVFSRYLSRSRFEE